MIFLTRLLKIAVSFQLVTFCNYIHRHYAELLMGNLLKQNRRKGEFKKSESTFIHIVYIFY